MPVAAQLPAVAHDEELPDRGAGEHHQDQHQPVARMVPGEAVVVAQHREQHRQREIGVVHTALLSALAVDGVDRLAGLDRRDHLLLARDDPEQDVGAHGGGEHRAHQQERGAPGEPVAGQPGGDAHQHQHQRADDGVAILALRRTSRQIASYRIQNTTRNDSAAAIGSRRRPVHHRLVDQVGAGIPQVRHREQREAGQPGRIAFPEEPVQVDPAAWAARR